MKIERCTKSDYDQILADISDFWGSDRTLHIHHPMFIHEFGDSAYVIKINDRVIAYLFGFIAQTSPTAYVHLLGVRNDYQSQGLGSALYGYFITYAKGKGCTKIKAMTIPANASSIGFHKKIGMKLIGNKNSDGIEVISDYSGPGQDRVVFEKEI